jgi:N-acetylneuraminic acid mutarotase
VNKVVLPFVAVIVCLVSDTPSRAISATTNSPKTLTLAQRVGYQRAIEEVYWRHRIWPKDNLGPKPPLDAVISRAMLEKKVQDYLRDSRTLENYWRQPVTAQQLQAEMNRMALHTKQPEVLQELFEALKNDPFVIAECLARPTLAERLLADSANELVKQTRLNYGQVVAASGNYSLPSISSASGCADNTWTATTTANAPSARSGHTAVWTGSEVIVWSGGDTSHSYNTGARYHPSTDSWSATSISNAPAARAFHTAVWTGSEMIVWGGNTFGGNVNTGGRYNPSTNTWIATSIINAPSARFGQTAVWTGSEMIVWGSYDFTTTGGRYNPGTDTWATTSIVNAPSRRQFFTAVWTGNEMIIWGGFNGVNFLNSGKRYNPSTDSWAPTSTSNAPSEREAHTAVWTGSEMIVWGGDSDGSDVNTGGRYRPDTNTWSAASIINAPSGRELHTAVWTGSEMIVWGGGHATSLFNTGGRYNPSTDSWTTTSTTQAPSGRHSHTAVWIDSEMIVWGGGTGSRAFNTGGRYCAEPPIVPVRLGNVSTRAFVQTNDNVMIGGFIVQGPQTKRVIIRAIGPELAQYGIPNPLLNPTLELHDGTGALIAFNNNWMTTIIGGIIRQNQVRDIMNSDHAPADARESAIIADLPQGNYTAIVRGINYTTGIALVEVYELNPDTTSILANISTRSFVQTGDNVMIGGFIVQGPQPKRVIIRALGPELSAPPFNIPDALANPTLEVHDHTGALIASNDNWQHTIIGGIIITSQVRDITNSGYAPGDPMEAAIIADLQPGSYTAIVRGANNTTGVGLVEVYDLD